MKKRLVGIGLVVLVVISMLSACGSPQSASLEGDGNGGGVQDSTVYSTTTTRRTTTTTCSHKWEEATCSTPKKCSRCGVETGPVRAHTFFNAKCTACGAKTPNFSKIQEWLVDECNTFYMLETIHGVISSSLELYKLTKDLDYISQIQDKVSAISDILERIQSFSQQYPELRLLTDACDIERPWISTSSSYYAYALSARTYAERAKRLISHFESVCEDFGLEITITYE